MQNEKYIGDALLQKTYTVDFLSKKRVKNNGIVPQYYVEGSHEAIIPRDLYMQVQEERVRRANLHSGAKRKKRVYSSKYELSSIVYCPRCGEVYCRIAWNNRGKHSIVWRCCTRVEHDLAACDAPTIQESDLQNAVVKAIHAILTSGRIEQQSYRSCMGLLKLAEKYSPEKLEQVCAKALSYSGKPSYKSIKNLLAATKDAPDTESESFQAVKPHGITRGARYYGGKKS